jgi:hypothetical protein
MGYANLLVAAVYFGTRASIFLSYALQTEAAVGSTNSLAPVKLMRRQVPKRKAYHNVHHHENLKPATILFNLYLHENRLCSPVIGIPDYR